MVSVFLPCFSPRDVLPEVLRVLLGQMTQTVVKLVNFDVPHHGFDVGVLP